MKTKFFNIPKPLRKDFEEVCNFMKDKAIKENEIIIKATIKEVTEGEWGDLFRIWKELQEIKDGRS